MDKKRLLRLVFWISSAFSAMIFIFGIICVSYLQDKDVSQAADEFRQAGLSIVFKSGLTESYNKDSLSATLAGMKLPLASRPWVFDADGKLLFGPGKGTSSPADDRKVQKAMLMDTLESVVYRAQAGGRVLALVIPVEQVNADYFFVLSAPLREIDAPFMKVKIILLFGSIFLALLLFVVLGSLVGWLGRTAARASAVFR